MLIDVPLRANLASVGARTLTRRGSRLVAAAMGCVAGACGAQVTKVDATLIPCVTAADCPAPWTCAAGVCCLRCSGPGDAAGGPDGAAAPDGAGIIEPGTEVDSADAGDPGGDAGDLAGVACNAGSYCAGDGASGPCPAGTYQPDPGMPGCLDSGVGYYVGSSGAVTRSICSAGSYCPLSRNVAPTPCGAGSYTDTQGDVGASTCALCGAGAYCPGDGAPHACAVGTYQPSTGQSSCANSGAGYYVDQAGATSRTACTAGGNYCPLDANSGVSDCAAGYYTNTGGTAGAYKCNECGVGYYCTGNGARQSCSGGKSSPPGSDASGDCGCNMKMTICAADCSNFPSGCAYGSTQWVSGASPSQSYCIPDVSWGHGRESVSCTWTGQ